MDRVIVYPGQIPLETDLLRTNRNTMLEVSKLAASILGTGVHASGFACTPTDPASLAVSVAPGQLYKLLEIDATDYSSLDADAREALKQGYMLDAVTLSTPAPGTAGQSINYLVQATIAEDDSDEVVLPYYNATNPTHGYAGPNDAGTSQDTTRGIVVTVSVKAGTAATTGTQTTPSPDAGYSPLWVVTVDNGDSSVDINAIAKHDDAPFIPYTLPELNNASTIVDIFSASGTWTKSANAKLIVVLAWGAGGGGGSGLMSATGSVSHGGGGGGGGSHTFDVFLASDLGATESVVIGAGGTGGAGASIDNGHNAGSSGGNTTFGSSKAIAFGGAGGGVTSDALGGGGAGSSAAAVAENGGSPDGVTAYASTTGPFNGGLYGGGSGGNAASFTAFDLAPGVSSRYGGGGGGAGSESGGNPNSAAGAGGSSFGFYGGGGAPGVSSNTAPTAGGNGNFREGGGGGGSSAAYTAPGANGGNGGYGGGGGGGGGGCGGSIGNPQLGPSGTGGDGGDGFCIVITYE